MKHVNCNLLMAQIWLKYCSVYKFCFEDCSPHCYLKEKEIYFPIKRFQNPDKRDVFDMLHEIGHLETNSKGMKRCEEEYYATKWAIQEMKKYGFDLGQKDKQIFQNYIWKWRETGLKLKAKNMPSKEELILVW